MRINELDGISSDISRFVLALEWGNIVKVSTPFGSVPKIPFPVKEREGEEGLAVFSRGLID